MTTLLVAVAFAVGLSSGVGLTKVKRRGPVNIVRGILLPNASDERWVRHTENDIFSRTSHWLRLGDVEVSPTSLWVDKFAVSGSAAKRYAGAVFDAYQERKALIAAVGEP